MAQGGLTLTKSPRSDDQHMDILKPPAVRWLFWCCAGSILYFALANSPTVTLSSSDKINHVLAFLVLQVLGALSWSSRVHVVALGLVAYGASIEVLQSLTPTRQAEWQDLAADMLGIALALAGTHAFRRLRKRRG